MSKLNKWYLAVMIVWIIALLFSGIMDCFYTIKKQEYTELIKEQNLLLQKQNTLLLEVIEDGVE